MVWNILGDLSGVFLQVGGATILTSPFFVNYILPFILVFTVIFALLQKSKILGGGKATNRCHCFSCYCVDCYFFRQCHRNYFEFDSFLSSECCHNFGIFDFVFNGLSGRG